MTTAVATTVRRVTSVEDEYTDATEMGIIGRRAGRKAAQAAVDQIETPSDELEALAFWERLAEIANERIPPALANAAETRSWPAIGAALATSAPSAAQRHRRYSKGLE